MKTIKVFEVNGKYVCFNSGKGVYLTEYKDLPKTGRDLMLNGTYAKILYKDANPVDIEVENDWIDKSYSHIYHNFRNKELDGESEVELTANYDRNASAISIKSIDGSSAMVVCHNKRLIEILESMIKIIKEETA